MHADWRHVKIYIQDDKLGLPLLFTKQIESLFLNWVYINTQSLEINEKIPPKKPNQEPADGLNNCFNNDIKKAVCKSALYTPCACPCCRLLIFYRQPPLIHTHVSLAISPAKLDPWCYPSA